jgi:hypothetical protein
MTKFLDEPEASIARVLKAVGDIPAELDRQELLSDLMGTLSLYRTGVGMRHAPRAREERFDRAVRALEYAKSQIEADYVLVRDRSALDRVIEHIREVAAVPTGLRDFLQVHDSSAFDNLIRMLLSTFKKHFPDRTIYRKDLDGEIHGPFIDFVESALNELGITNYSRKYIAETVRKIRHTP